MAKRPTETTETLPAQTGADLDFVNHTGRAVINALNKAAAFFQKADQLEATALADYDRARKWPRPTNIQEDLTIQGEIVTLAGRKRALAEHWTVTTALHQLHRRFTSRRNIASDALEKASERLNALHAEFVETQQRAARLKAELEQAERDAAARAEQERIAADLEAEALRAEAALGATLSEREQVFVRVWVETGNPIEAARQAGYKAPENSAARLMGLVKVQEAVGAARAAAEYRAQAQATIAAPVVTEAVSVDPAVERLAGHHDRETYAAEIFNEAVLLEAVFTGRVPRDIVKIDPAAVNRYARILRATMNWPGVRVTKKRTVV